MDKRKPRDIDGKITEIRGPGRELHPMMDGGFAERDVELRPNEVLYIGREDSTPNFSYEANRPDLRIAENQLLTLLVDNETEGPMSHVQMQIQFVKGQFLLSSCSQSQPMSYNNETSIPAGDRTQYTLTDGVTIRCQKVYLRFTFAKDDKGKNSDGWIKVEFKILPDQRQWLRE